MILINIFLVVWIIVISLWLLTCALGFVIAPFALIYKSFWNDDADDKRKKRKLLFSLLFFVFSILLLTFVITID